MYVNLIDSFIMRLSRKYIVSLMIIDARDL